MNKRYFKPEFKMETVDTTEHTIEFIMTTETTDRHGDIVDVDSIKLDNYMLNPVVLPQHDHSSPAIGKVVELRKEMVNGLKALIGKVKFAVGLYDVADTYWNLYSKGFMSAVSIGFIPESAEARDGSFVLFGSELLELSMVSIPANQLALAKSAGINVKPLLRNNAFMKELRDTTIAIKELMEDLVDDQEVENEVPETVETVETDTTTDTEHPKEVTAPAETPENTPTSDENAKDEELTTEKKISYSRAISIFNKAIRELNKATK